MSFSSELRAELARGLPSGRQARDTAAATLLLNLFRFSAGEQGKDGDIFMQLSSGNREAVRKCFTIIQKNVKISPDLFGKNKEPQLLTPEFTGYLSGLQILDGEGTLREQDGTLPPALVRGSRSRAYLREMFLCSGFMSDPGQRYHLEFRCCSQPQAAQLLEVLGHNGVTAGMTCRKRYHVVYVKDSEEIVTLLHLMGASVSLMATENARILKEVRNSVNRRVNCETANIGKTVESAVRQKEDIRLLRERGILQALAAPLREAADLRENYPGASLSELGKLADPPVGRSGMNHRMRKLSALADKVRGQEP